VYIETRPSAVLGLVKVIGKKVILSSTQAHNMVSGGGAYFQENAIVVVCVRCRLLIVVGSGVSQLAV